MSEQTEKVLERRNEQLRFENDRLREFNCELGNERDVLRTLLADSEKRHQELEAEIKKVIARRNDLGQINVNLCRQRDEALEAAREALKIAQELRDANDNLASEIRIAERAAAMPVEKPSAIRTLIEAVGDLTPGSRVEIYKSLNGIQILLS